MACTKQVFILIGPMGSGKSTQGQLLSERLALIFYDLDCVIAHEAKKSIADIFTHEGEVAFRRLESDALAKLIKASLNSVDKTTIISTGGGAILKSENQALLAKDNAFVVYLKTSPKQQWKRISADKNLQKRRPLLDVADPLKILTKLYEERHPLYQSVATIEIDTHNKSKDAICDEIIKNYLD